MSTGGILTTIFMLDLDINFNIDLVNIFHLDTQERSNFLTPCAFFIFFKIFKIFIFFILKT